MNREQHTRDICYSSCLGFDEATTLYQRQLLPKSNPWNTENNFGSLHAQECFSARRAREELSACQGIFPAKTQGA